MFSSMYLRCWMREPEEEAVIEEESKESEAMASYISLKVRKVEAGDAEGVREPAVAVRARRKSAMNAMREGLGSRERKRFMQQEKVVCAHSRIITGHST